MALAKEDSALVLGDVIFILVHPESIYTTKETLLKTWPQVVNGR